MLLKRIHYLKDNIAYIPLLEDKGIKHGFSWGHNKNMSFAFGEFEEVHKRNKEFLTFLDMGNVKEAVVMVAEHLDRIIDINSDNLNEIKSKYQTNRGIQIECDALFTDVKGLVLVAKPADCSISIIRAIDKNGKYIAGLVHGGKKGIELNLPNKAIRHLVDKYGCNINDIYIGVAPTIAKHNYFLPHSPSYHFTPGEEDQSKGFYFDILGGLIDELCSENIPDRYRVADDHIQAYDIDTFESAKKGEGISHRYYSGFGNGGNGRFMVVVQIPK